MQEEQMQEHNSSGHKHPYIWIALAVLVLVTGAGIGLLYWQTAQLAGEISGLTQTPGNADEVKRLSENYRNEMEKQQQEQEKPDEWKTYETLGLMIPYPAGWHIARQGFQAGGIEDLALDINISTLIAIDTNPVYFPAYHEIAYPWGLTMASLADEDEENLLAAIRDSYDSFEEKEESSGSLVLHRFEGTKTVLGRESKVVTYAIFLSGADVTDRAFYLTTSHRADREQEEHTQDELIEVTDDLVEEMKRMNPAS